MYINGFWCGHKDSSWGSRFSPDSEKLSAVTQISGDGTLCLRACIREIVGSGLLRRISHDRVLLTPRADGQHLLWGAHTTNLNGWTSEEVCEEEQNTVYGYSYLLLVFTLFVWVTRLIYRGIGWYNLFTDISCAPSGVSWGPERRLDVVVAMGESGWGVRSLSPCGLLLVVCASVCLCQQPNMKPAECSRKEHPVVSHQGQRIRIHLL